jgi:hypothetical protein
VDLVLCLILGMKQHASVGHGLGVAPDLIIKKRIELQIGVWYTYNKVLGNNILFIT